MGSERRALIGGSPPPGGGRTKASEHRTPSTDHRAPLQALRDSQRQSGEPERTGENPPPTGRRHTERRNTGGRLSLNYLNVVGVTRVVIGCLNPPSGAGTVMLDLLIAKSVSVATNEGR